MAYRKTPAPEPERAEKIPCAYECSGAAIVRYRNSNLCKEDYIHMTGIEAREWCALNGLTTKEKMLAFCKTKKPLKSREPGE